jgi:iron complex transport system ATP-binding protein
VRIETEQLCVDRGPRRVLDDVSFAARDGETVAIVGPNGAGKTTLLLSLLRLLPARAGTVRIDGEPTEAMSRRAIARRLAYVPQIYEGFLGFRVRDIVATGRYAHLDPLEPMRDADERAVEAAIDRCGIGAFVDRTPDTLSGGERQKVWLAAAVAQGSPALLLDEPTNSLDPKHQAELIRLLRSLAAEGRTLIVVCHDLNLPVMLGARVVALRGGRVAYDGSGAAFLVPDRLRDVFDTEFVWLRDERSGAAGIQLKV